jgi:hypothetical protein
VPALAPRAGGEHLDACHLDVEDKRARRGTTIDPTLVESA